MNLKIRFTIELILGAVVFAAILLWLARLPLLWNSSVGNIVAFFLIYAYNKSLYIKPKNDDDTDLQFLKKTGISTAILFIIPLAIFGWSLLNPGTGFSMHVLHFYGFYCFTLYLIFHSITGLAILKYGLLKKLKEEDAQS